MKPRLAIVGSGIAGLGCAYLLAEQYDLTIFEKNNYTGGHTNTITVAPEISFDTGFMVFNHQTYPLLTKLFADLDVPTKKTDMSFSVQYLPDNIEWNGAGLDKVFAQRKNLLSPRFWRMLTKLDWFNKNAPSHLTTVSGLTVREYVAKHALGQDFLNWYLVPMGASVWSTPPDKMLDFPIEGLIRFFHNHGFLGLDTHFQWYTVDGGAKKYVEKITAKFPAVRHNLPVLAVETSDDCVSILTEQGRDNFDKVILACHANQALALLKQPTVLEQQLLSPFKYQDNQITVHSDRSIMPRQRSAWASWNYRVARGGEQYLPTLHYWMNSLQGVGGDAADTSGKDNYFVSLNSDDLIDQKLVHRKMSYTHPLFDLATFKAQAELARLNQTAVAPSDKAKASRSIFFCGSYFKNGFHEDAFASAVDLASLILGQRVFV